MFYPGKVENWIIIIETNEVSVFGMPYGVATFKNYLFISHCNKLLMSLPITFQEV